MDSFPNYMRQMRIKSGLTLREIAAGLNISTTYYTDVEKGRRYPMALEKLMQFGSITGMSRDEIYTLLDLAGQARGTIAPDIADYIISNHCVGAALRMARDLGAECADWENFTKRLMSKYQQPSPAE